MKTDKLLPISAQNASLTMSSREIAELCEKQHKHVMADIRKMLDELEISSAEFSAQYKTVDGRMQPCFNLPKDLTLTLIVGYNVKLRKKIIDRWQELENQQKQTAILPDFTNPAESARAWAEQYEKCQQSERQVAFMKPKADFVDNYVEVGTSKSFREVAKILKMPEKALINRLIEDKCLYRQSGNLLPYQTAHSKELFTVKTGTSDYGHNYTQTRVTGKGIEWIAQRYASELML